MQRREAFPRRSGTTLLEASVVLTLLGVIASIGVGASASVRDRSRVRAVADATRAALHEARAFAMASGRATAVHFLADSRVMVIATADTVAIGTLAPALGVMLTSTRDSMAYRRSGLGLGAANLRVVVTRGTAADTIDVSRLGRVR